MTKIEWTEKTWNPTTGCDRISPGCDHCYALDMAKRLKAMGQAKYQNDGDPRTSGPGFGLTVHPDTLDTPLHWTGPQPAGIPIHRVSAGNIRQDALNPEHRFASMPLHILNRDGTPGMGRRQCTAEYKLKPIKAAVRELLGYPHPTPVPRGVFVEQWIGISVDEIHRAKDSDVRYARNTFPLLDLGWRRTACERYLRAHGYGDTPKSACVGCPMHGNRQWRAMREHQPDEWADAIAFDAAIRASNARGNANGRPLLGTAYLHTSRVPLDQAPIDRVSWHEWKGRQTDLLDAIADQELEDGDPDGCSPWTCRSGEPVQDETDATTEAVAS